MHTVYVCARGGCVLAGCWRLLLAVVDVVAFFDECLGGLLFDHFDVGVSLRCAMICCRASIDAPVSVRREWRDAATRIRSAHVEAAARPNSSV